MKWNHSLDKVIRDYGISAKWLSAESGISEVMISQFRKGHKDATTKTLSALLKPLPFEAQARFHSLILGESLPPAATPTVEEQIQRLDRETQKKSLQCT